ncbi:alkylation response protein AidB-like acyl-CoA dehydrogenase [Bradyrhizobium sp. i1.3.1]
MDFTMSVKQKKWLDRVQSFVTEHVRPAVPVYEQQDAAGDRWKLIPVVEDLKMKARAKGLWNMFLPPSSHEDRELRGAGLSNLEYAPLAEEMGRIGWASEVFNCSAPDTGNMEVLIRYGTEAQKQQWLKPLMNGEIRSAFLMTEPAVASSDATNIETRIERDGNHYIVNGRIMVVVGRWRSPMHDYDRDGQDRFQRAAPSTAIADSSAARHARHQDRKDVAGVRL